jgi:hypothetical protein
MVLEYLAESPSRFSGIRREAGSGRIRLEPDRVVLAPAYRGPVGCRGVIGSYRPSSWPVA